MLEIPSACSIFCIHHQNSGEGNQFSHQEDTHHKNSLGSGSTADPPHAANLSDLASNLFSRNESQERGTKVTLQHSDLEFCASLLKELCLHIRQNVTWANYDTQDSSSLSRLQVLVDATRALGELQKRSPRFNGGDGSIPSHVWGFYCGRRACWGKEVWDLVAIVWKKYLCLDTAFDHANDHEEDVARLLLDTYLTLEEYGYEALEPIIKNDKWVAMARVCREKEEDLLLMSRPDTILNASFVSSFILHVRKCAENEQLFRRYTSLCVPLLNHFIRSEQVKEYLNHAVLEYSAFWDECLEQPDPAMAWSVGLFHGFMGDERMERQKVFNDIIRPYCDQHRSYLVPLSTDRDEASVNNNELCSYDLSNGFSSDCEKALQMTFLNVEKCFQECFKATVDSNCTKIST